MFHVHAWGFPYVATLLGAKQVYPGRYEPEKLLKLIEKEGVTYSHCVPTILQMLLNCPTINEVDLSNWKVTIGGARLPRGLARAAKELGIEIHAGYGMWPGPPKSWASKFMPAMACRRPVRLSVRRRQKSTCSIGKTTCCWTSLLKPAGRFHWWNLRFSMRKTTESYFKEPDKTEALWRNGWLHSGDVGYIDEEGYLQITDRIKDVIKSGGEWISSLDLENLMSQHEAVLESAAIGIPDEKWGERPLMIVTKKENCPNTACRIVTNL
jgi:fatty-acyl-CoA synthase